MIQLNEVSRLFDGDAPVITTIDSHTEGEITRLILDGIPPLTGRTMMEKLTSFRTDHDAVRRLLTREPRGSRQVLAALVTEPVTRDSAFGLIYMDARRYPYLCGHATIGAVTTLARTGTLTLAEGENRLGIDTPSGRMTAIALVRNGRLTSVSIQMVPTFVFATDQQIQVKGFGTIPVDLVCAGGFFAMVDTRRIDLTPTLENKKILVDLGMKIIEAANDQLTVTHPERPDVTTVDVTEFYDSVTTDGPARGRGMVVYGESHMDRSPCGTGTAAKLALLHHQGKIELNQPYINASPLGTTFEARLMEKTRIGDFEASVTQVSGKAWITGVHHFTLDHTDPFQQGYLV
ncbi:MAG: proline racemase family protein [Desulfotignum sp.]|nr:proline racemase family protein [Desulfotignum sp.]